MAIPNGILVHTIANILLKEGISIHNTMRLSLHIANTILTLQIQYQDNVVTKVRDLVNVEPLKPGELDPRD